MIKYRQAPAEKLVAMLLEDSDPEEIEMLAQYPFMWKDQIETVLEKALLDLGMASVSYEGRPSVHGNYLLSVVAQVGTKRIHYPMDALALWDDIAVAIHCRLYQEGANHEYEFTTGSFPSYVESTPSFDDYGDLVPNTEIAFSVIIRNLPAQASQLPLSPLLAKPTLRDDLMEAGKMLGCTPLIHMSKGTELGTMDVTLELPVQLPVWKRCLRVDRWSIVDRLMTTLSQKGWVPAAIRGCDVYSMNPLVEMCVMQFTVEGEVPDIKLDKLTAVQENVLPEGKFDPEEVKQIAFSAIDVNVEKLESLKVALEKLGFVDVRVGVLPTRAPSNYRGMFPTRLLMSGKDPKGDDPGLWGVVEISALHSAAVASGFNVPRLSEINFHGMWGITVRDLGPGEESVSFPVEVENPTLYGLRVPHRLPYKIGA